MWIKLLVLIAFVCGTTGMAFVILSFVAFDSILSKLVQDRPDHWIKLGKPIGFFWMPKHPLETIKGGFTRSGLYVQWKHRPMGELAAEDLPVAELARMKKFAKMSMLCFAGFLTLILAAVAMVLWR